MALDSYTQGEKEWHTDADVGVRRSEVFVVEAVALAEAA
jgi:hypothetical protein